MNEVIGVFQNQFVRRLRCDECGKGPSEPILGHFDEVAEFMAKEGWLSYKLNRRERYDFCPDCLEKGADEV